MVQVPWLGSADSTVEPAGNVAVKVTPVCGPSPSLVTVNVCCTWLPAVTIAGSLASVTGRSPLGGGIVSNVALTDWSALIVTVQLPAPSHAPPQPVNVDPSFGSRGQRRPTGRRRTSRCSCRGQAIPAGSDVTEPAPVDRHVQRAGHRDRREGRADRLVGGHRHVAGRVAGARAGPAGEHEAGARRRRQRDRRALGVRRSCSPRGRRCPSGPT